jgi:DNA invertase Pin-like site-specific DNA recombinase
MKVGYTRISTEDQNHDLQLDALKNAGCKIFFSDKASGGKADRPGLIKALDYLRQGDCLIVWKLDRLGRNLKHLIEVVEDLKSKKIGFMSLQDGLDTTTNGGKFVFQIFGAMAEFERDLIRERTKAGLDAARARGRTGGRKEKLNDTQVAALKTMYESKNHSLSEICSTFGITKPTLYRYLEKINQAHK